MASTAFYHFGPSPELGRRSGLSGMIWAHCRRSKGAPFEVTTFLIRVRFLRGFERSSYRR
jgi:hypothetical protein